jgi:hypothetical protein
MATAQRNTISDLIGFFNSGKNPLTYNKFLDYWDSLSKAEQEELRTMDLEAMRPRKTEE